MQQMIRFDLPYAEYWIPLLIGMLVGVGAIVVGRLVFGQKTSAALGDRAGVSADDALVKSKPVEQRQALRRDGNPIEIYLAPPGYKERPTRGFVVDRSLGGLCLALRDEVKPGTVLSILPVKAPEMTHWVDIEVKSCRPSGEEWEVGCQFVKTPPFSILLMFG